jgi:nucleoside-triphosphatase THEP1
MKAVYLFTGPVKSGKSSKLTKWIKTKQGVAGILSLVIDGKKHLYSISKKQDKCLESFSENALEVGRYKFDPDVFLWAQKELIESIKKNPDFLIIDEIGPLEINGSGMEPAVSQVLKLAEEMPDLTLIIVVRESMAGKIQGFYNLKQVRLIDDLQDIAQ